MECACYFGLYRFDGRNPQSTHLSQWFVGNPHGNLNKVLHLERLQFDTLFVELLSKQESACPHT